MGLLALGAPAWGRAEAAELMTRLGSSARDFNRRGEVLAQGTAVEQGLIDPEVLKTLQALGYLD